MKTRSKEKLPGLFDASSTGPLEVLRRDRAVTETEATLIETRSTVGKYDVPRAISKVTVKVFARHSAGCPHDDDIYWRDCHCCKGIYIYRNGHDRRISAKTRTWDKAEKKRQEIEDSLDPVKEELKRLKEAQQAKRIRIPDAVQGFLSDAAARNLASSTQRSHRSLCREQLLTWSERNGLLYLDELTTPQLTIWRSTWPVGPLTRKVRQDQAGTFFEFCVRQGWLERNPARWLSRIKVKHVPNRLFSPRGV